MDESSERNYFERLVKLETESKLSERIIKTELGVIEIKEDLKTAVGRIASDAESEKATRSRMNDIITRSIENIARAQAKTDRIVYMGLGGLGVFELIINILFRH